MRRLVALAVMVVLAVSLVGCGSAGSGSTTAAAGPVVAAWQLGLRRWSHEMLGALDRLSELFASPHAATAIAGSEPKTDAQLTALEATLDACTARIERLGPPPADFALSRTYALRACESLEEGSKLVREGVKEVQGGRGSDLLADSTEPLSDGQGDVGLATSQLAPTPG